MDHLMNLSKKVKYLMKSPLYRINRRRIRYNALESHIAQIFNLNDVIDSDTGRLFLHILWKYECTEKSKNIFKQYSSQQY
jgi:hypothetical protein